MSFRTLFVTALQASGTLEWTGHEGRVHQLRVLADELVPRIR
jgi:hypothetical protein